MSMKQLQIPRKTSRIPRRPAPRNRRSGSRRKYLRIPVQAHLLLRKVYCCLELLVSWLLGGLLDKLDDVIDVRIKDYEYVWKDGKKSTVMRDRRASFSLKWAQVYVISFNTFFKSFEIQRGYSDFYKLYKKVVRLISSLYVYNKILKTMKAYPTIPLPPFPEKKGTT